MSIDHFRAIPASVTVRKVVGPTILLYGGTYFDFLDPAGSTFTIQDIAHALSQICRFGAQCRRFYSVAQHSVHVSQLVPPEHAYAALMHDAPEAFMGDMVKPLKDLLPEYRTIEDAVEAAVFARFAVPSPLSACVKEADIVMLATEQVHIMANRDDWNYTRGREPANIDLPDWPPTKAKRAFLDRFAALTSGERAEPRNDERK